MPQPYVSGPVDIYVAGYQPITRYNDTQPNQMNVGTPYFLGNAEGGPQIQIRREFDSVFTDFSGTKIPLDYSYQGEEGLVAAKLTYKDEAVFAAIQGGAKASQNLFSGNLQAFKGAPETEDQLRGVDLPGELGSLIMTEGLGLILFLHFTYSSVIQPVTQHPVMRSGGQPSGYRFLCATLIGPDELQKLGTGTRTDVVVFRCQRQFQRVGGVGPVIVGGAGGINNIRGVGRLFDHQLAGLTGAVILA